MKAFIVCIFALFLGVGSNAQTSVVPVQKDSSITTVFWPKKQKKQNILLKIFTTKTPEQQYTASPAVYYIPVIVKFSAPSNRWIDDYRITFWKRFSFGYKGINMYFDSAVYSWEDVDQ